MSSARQAVLLWCHNCDAESTALVAPNRSHDLAAYEILPPWRIVVVQGARGPLRFLGCSDACAEAIAKGIR